LTFLRERASRLRELAECQPHTGISPDVLALAAEFEMLAATVEALLSARPALDPLPA
jgi:hypothetical protein